MCLESQLGKETAVENNDYVLQMDLELLMHVSALENNDSEELEEEIASKC
jgi:hypothetical protein